MRTATLTALRAVRRLPHEWNLRAALAADPGFGGVLRPRLGTTGYSRLLAAALALMVLVASAVGVSVVNRLETAGTGNVSHVTQGRNLDLRLAIGGEPAGDSTVFTVVGGGTGSAAGEGRLASSYQAIPSTEFARLGLADLQGLSNTASGARGAPPATENEPAAESVPEGPFLADGTLLKPVAVDTSSPDARSLLVGYRVKAGDSLSAIATRYKISVSTLWWANHLATGLTSTTDLKIGHRLVVPPMDGVLHIVTDQETLAGVASRMKVSAASIVAANKLSDPTLHIGQWILIPGAKNKPMPAAPRSVRLAVSPLSRQPQANGSSSAAAQSAAAEAVGRMVWPVRGGFVSQHFHGGHLALDIAGTYGQRVFAAAVGVVSFAGWKNNGGGYQVWISHARNVFTTYSHLSGVSVGIGQSVAAGQQLGRLGTSGAATGPHCHFAVWIGPVWAGGTPVNPLKYL